MEVNEPYRSTMAHEQESDSDSNSRRGTGPDSMSENFFNPCSDTIFVLDLHSVLN